MSDKKKVSDNIVGNVLCQIIQDERYIIPWWNIPFQVSFVFRNLISDPITKLIAFSFILFIQLLFSVKNYSNRNSGVIRRIFFPRPIKTFCQSSLSCVFMEYYGVINKETIIWAILAIWKFDHPKLDVKKLMARNLFKKMNQLLNFIWLRPTSLPLVGPWHINKKNAICSSVKGRISERRRRISKSLFAYFYCKTGKVASLHGGGFNAALFFHYKFYMGEAFIFEFIILHVQRS